MDDGNQTVGGVSGGGPEGSPDPSASQQQSQPIAGDVSQLLAGLESKLSDRFKSIEDRLTGLKKVQSDIDKSQSAFREQLAKFNQYKKDDMSDEEALAEMESDDAFETRWARMEQKLEDLAGRIAGNGTPANGQQQAVAAVFSQLGLDLKDPRVAEALTKEYPNADAVELAAYRLQRATVSPPTNSAQNASLSGGSSNAVNLDALAEEYERLSVNPSQNYERMSAIQQEIDRAIK